MDVLKQFFVIFVLQSDNQDTEKSHSDVDNNSNHENGNNRDYVSSPGYDTSSSTAPASSPDPCEYTYEGAIEGYKLRISRAQSIGFNGFNNGRFSKDSTPERASSLDSGRSSGHENGASFVPKRPSVTKIEDRLINFELKSCSDSTTEGNNGVTKKDLPKVDILKRRELFEKDKPAAVTIVPMESNVQKRLSGDFSNAKSIKERLSSFEQVQKDDSGGKKANRLSGDLSSIKERLSILEEKSMCEEKPLKVDVPVVSLKDRLTSLHSAVTASSSASSAVFTVKQEVVDEPLPIVESAKKATEVSNVPVEVNCEDSGIHTSDISNGNQSQIVEHMEEALVVQSAGEDKSEELTLEESTAIHDTSNNDMTASTLVESSSSAVSAAQESDLIPTDECSVNHDETLLPADVTTNELFDENCASDLTEQDTSVSVSEASQSLVFEGKLIIDVKHLVNSISGASQNSNSHITKQSTVEEVEFEETDSVALLTPATDVATAIVTLPLPRPLTPEPTPEYTLVVNVRESPGRCESNIEAIESGNVNPPKNFETPLKITIDCPPQANIEEAKSSPAKSFPFKSSSSSPKSPLSPKSPTRTILDFIRNNLLESPSNDTPTATFYVPLDSYDDSTQTLSQDQLQAQDLPSSKMPPSKVDSVESSPDSVNSEISNLLDEELSKLD